MNIPVAEALNLADLVTWSEGGVVSRTLSETPAGTLTLFAFDKGQGLSEHSAPFDAVVQVLEGEARLTIGGKAVQVRAGQLAVMPANVPHAVRAEEPMKMLLSMFRA